MNSFLKLLQSNPNQYIGYGNPTAEICFVGKEATGMLPLQCGLGSINYWMATLPIFFDRKKVDNPNDSIWKEGHTWNKYQKLYDAIFPERKAMLGTMNFEQSVFVTEMSAMPATTTAEGRNADGFDEQLAHRKQTFFAHPYFKEFKVIVLACSDYIVNFGDRREIDTLFNVTFDIDGGAHEVGPQNSFWVHHSPDGKRLVIHTRQLSGAVSDKMLDEMGKVIRGHLGTTTNVPNGNLSLGMTKNECISICGEPLNIRKETNPMGEWEWWSYENARLTFRDGVLFRVKE